ncbi:hypothetical protein [Citrobacter portucalensis]|uniref:hypothetical protein n=2 Tax=Enterobacteriaceae TaxID=543 RepID=UPI001F2FBCBB|nr:hypothetical protein [Citrobacter portucalensis]MCE9762358.1 hypothetical protein [Citrobacter portucalensis]
METPVYGIPLTVESGGNHAPGVDKHPGTNSSSAGYGALINFIEGEFMDKKQFKAMSSEYRKRAGRYVRNGWRGLFSDLQSEFPLMVKCQPSDRPVSIRVWLKLDSMRSSLGNR